MKECKRCGGEAVSYPTSQQYCKPCHRDVMREHRLKKLYGVSPAVYNAMKEELGSRCMICGHPEGDSTRALHIDHSHVTGKTRGLLCLRCNQVLGRVKDNWWLLDRLSDYLKGQLKRLEDGVELDSSIRKEGPNGFFEDERPELLSGDFGGIR